MLTYRVSAKRIDHHGSLATTKQAEIVLDTDIAGRDDAFNPVELLLAALSACMIKGIERVAPMIHFQYEGVEVALEAIRQDAPPRLIEILYELKVATDETAQRLELLHTNVQKYGTIFNTLAASTPINGTIGRLI